MFGRWSPTAWFVFGVASCGLTAVPSLKAQAQLELSGPDQAVPPPLPSVADPVDAADLPEGAEVMVTGPLHEAFAEQFSDQAEPGIIVSKKPPEPIDEIPPEYRPDGQDIVWIPGYWGWDPERDDFLWITGIWRQAPPDRNWVPGYWAEIAEGFQWIAGFWSSNNTAEIVYLPPPPEPLVADPSTPAPSEDHFWIPGQWNYVNSNYQWRAGYWTMGYNDWVWVPDRYVWTPSGCIYRAGYWDYIVPERGTVFCPIYWSRPVVNYQFRPSYVVSTGPTLLANLFVYPRYHHYFFGNYYSSRFLGQTIHPWVTYGQQSRRYDSLYGYYRTQYRDTDYMNRLLRLHNYYAANLNYQPPRTLTAQIQQHQNFNDRQDLAFHAMQLNRMANVSGNLNHSMQLVRLADTERQYIQRGLDPAKEIRKQRAQFESTSRFDTGAGLAANNRDNSPNENRNDKNPNGQTHEHRWNVPQLQNGARLGSVAVGEARPRQDDQPNRNDVNRNDTNRDGVNRDGGNRNDAARNNTNRGDTNRGDTNRGDANRGDANRGDANRGDANRKPADGRGNGLDNAPNVPGPNNPADSNRDGVVDGRDQRQPNMRDRNPREAQGLDGLNRDPITRDPLKRDPVNGDTTARDAAGRTPNVRDPLNRDPNRGETNKGTNANRNPSPDRGSDRTGREPSRIPTPVPGLPGNSPAIRPGVVPNLPGTSPAFPGNSDKNRAPRANPVQPNSSVPNNVPNAVAPGGGRVGSAIVPGAGNPNARRSSSPPPANIQSDLQKIREQSQRQIQRRTESNATPRRAPQTPSGPKNEKGKDK